MKDQRLGKSKKGSTVIVRDYIMDYISHQQLKAGDMLPSEGELADQLNMSMSSVREATRSLEVIGIIEKRHGIGMALRSFNMDALHELLKYAMITDPSLIIDLYEVRRLLETALIPQVVERFGQDQYRHLRNLLDQWQERIKSRTPVYDIDQQFHDILFEKIDNKLLSAFSKVFWQIYEYLEYNQLVIRQFPQTQEMEQKTWADHQQILDLVHQGKIDLAQQSLSQHFNPIVQGIRHNIQEGG